MVHSPGRDLLITAAHCLSGRGPGLSFAPMYHDGVEPYGSWAVTAAYVDRRWLTARDPRADYAFLTVSPQQRSGRTVEVEDVAGADRLVTSPAVGRRVTVIGYVLGTAGKPITCTTVAGTEQGYLRFPCDGYAAGTSGSPFVVAAGGARRGEVVGVIGGLHQGGCTPQVSYSAAFGTPVRALYARAVAGGPGDDVPAAGGDGC